MHIATVLRNWTFDIIDLKSLSKEKHRVSLVYTLALCLGIIFQTHAYGA